MAVGIVAMVKVEYIYKLTDLLTDKLSDIFVQLRVLTSLDLNGLITSNAIILIAVGGFLFILGFLGCCGAMRKSSCMLNLVSSVNSSWICESIDIQRNVCATIINKMLDIQ